MKRPDESSASTTSTAAKPKRPLSAYNLFYRYKRVKILESKENGDDSKETLHRLISATPGLEGYPTTLMLPENEKELRRNVIRSALLNKLTPQDNTKRPHRKSFGAISFVEMNRSICDSCKYYIICCGLLYHIYIRLIILIILAHIHICIVLHIL